MIYKCPSCGNLSRSDYCESCKEYTEPQADNSHSNAMTVWGFIVLGIGICCLIAGVLFLLQDSQMWGYALSFGVAFTLFGLPLLGISAIVDRLNTIIRLLKKNKSD